MKKQSAFLILVHQARSFVYVGMIKQYLQKRDIQCLVISSRQITDEHLRKVESKSDKTWLVDEDDLTAENIEEAINSIKAEYQLLGSLATYEGYRLLMAKLNAEFSVKDASVEDLATCLDKYSCRKKLFSTGLSSADCHVISANNLVQLQQSETQYFVKPRRGIGSFACFKLTASLTYSEIEDYQKQMSEDIRFKNIFAGQYDFIAEAFITGDEYSFEVIVIDGESYVVGTHAKYVTDMFGTTVETGNSLPAANLTDQEQQEGEQFVTQCLESLNLSQGGYHIETRFDRLSNTWNIIEINARMGGALINQSVELFTGKYSFLELWVLSLCLQQPTELAEFKSSLSALRESYRRREKTIKNASVFISQYGMPGKTIAKISADNLSRKPDICEISVKAGTKLEDSARGIMVLNALWKVDVDSINEELESLYQVLEKDLVLEYQ